MCNFGDIFVCDINLGFGLPPVTNPTHSSS